MYFIKKSYLFFVALFLFFSCSESNDSAQNLSVKNVMDEVITRLYKEVPADKYNAIDDDYMLNFLNDKEKEVLATKYQYFKVNVPVTVSLMREVRQPTMPFWIVESGFEKTDGIVKSEMYTYEVWQKDFDAGWVNLGINGFDMHRTVYFVSVGAKNPSDQLTITEHYPSKYNIITMTKGAFTYHDWSDLKIVEFPEALEGQQLFTTVRGRAREAHVKGAFRKTIFPSSDQPDQIMLNWSANAENSIDINWRTGTAVEDGLVKYWLVGSADTAEVKANQFLMEDRMLFNDRYVHRFSAHVAQLKDGAAYDYVVGSETGNTWSDVRSFETKKQGEDKFSFIWFGDTHRAKGWGDLLNIAHKRHPETDFYSIAGDLVSTGLYRTDWDEFFGNSGNVFSYKPLMPVPGNHDRQDGLGSWMYYEIFSLPKNGPEKVTPEATYAFEYGNALYLMIDCTQPNEAQTKWIEETLKNSSATWKFAVFHFPPYNYEEPYFDLQEEWCGIFDTYHVDMVMSGHIHYYMRSKPIKGGKVVDSHKDGTVYTVSVGTVGDHEHLGEESYAEQRYKKGQYYQHVEIDKGQMKYKAYDMDGNIVDEFSIAK